MNLIKLTSRPKAGNMSAFIFGSEMFLEEYLG